MNSSFLKFAWLVMAATAVVTVPMLVSGLWVETGSEADLRDQSQRARLALFRMNTAAIENLANLPGFRMVVLSDQPVHGMTVYAIPEHGNTAYRLNSIDGYQFAKISPEDDRSTPAAFHWMPLR